MEEKYDVIIVGTGAAGLLAALSLPKRLNILMITKDEIRNSNSYLAQGGICVLKEQKDYEAFFNDTMKAGRYENRKESVRVMIEESPQIIKRLTDYGVNFDKNKDGQFSYTKEGAHSTNRILHHKDVTGKEITETLVKQVQHCEHITVCQFTTLMDFIMVQNRCVGIVAKTQTGQITQLCSKAVILATGGMGGLFEHSTNFAHITGDGFAIAAKHNIELENLNYVQIHPTVLYSSKPGRGFLISEAVRGEGAVLLNNRRERFVDELQPRDVVSAAIREEMAKSHMDYVLLSLVGKPKEWIQQRFPNIYKRCLEEGYDMAAEPIPVTPAQHYLMGGIKTNINGETSAKNLYAVGEAGCNGVHGANRLASNSLLEGLVFAGRAASLVEKSIDGIPFIHKTISLDQYQDEKKWQDENKKTIMSEIKRKDKKFYDQWCNHEN